jgi:Ca-activated chloride channel family protein
MSRTHTDIRSGERLDLTVEFITRRSVDCAEGRVHRLLVVDQRGDQFAVLVQDGQLCGLQTGATVEFRSLLGAAPVTGAEPTDADCPDCGGALRRGQVADACGPAIAAAAAALDLDETFGVVDSQTTTQQARSDDAADDLIDDWQSFTDTGSVSPPDYVCPSCGRHVDEHELREHEGGEIAACAPPPGDARTVGLATGGANDVGNFRENLNGGYTPQPGAISEEGLFYDYYFETGERAETDALFAPRYGAAVSEHPIEGTTEQYLSVGLDSTLAASEFERPPLDLVAVLDVSGSMDSPFDRYYYDEHGRKREAGSETTKTGSEMTKMEAATQSLCALTEQLDDGDRLGVVLFNNRAHVAKPLRAVSVTDMPAIRQHIREVSAGGGTNLADGFEAAVDMLVGGRSASVVERRAVFMTDMMPNTGTTAESELVDLFADAAVEGVHTTFVGMGLDANADLAEALSGIRGANSYFVHSTDEFERRLGAEFDYMVTPLVYDLSLELRGDCEIEAVHGSPSADPTTGQLMHVGTLFPSAKENGRARGGVVLVRLRDAPADLELVASWTERNGGEHTERRQVALPEEPESFAHDGTRKAVALSRYARELRTWASHVHERADAAGLDDWPVPDQRGRHERESVPLVVPDRHAGRFDGLRAYLADEMAAVGDDSLQQELDVLATLCEETTATPTSVSD